MTSDIIDLANEQADRFLRDALASVPKPSIKLYSHCLNCTEPLPKPGVYCDTDCRTDHEAILAAATRNRSYE